MKRYLQWILAAIAMIAGAVIAWVDTRPTWDDTGVTAAVLLIAAGVASFLGLRWWLAALLLAAPLLIVESRAGGWGLLLVASISAAGAIVGRLLRGVARSGSIGSP